MWKVTAYEEKLNDKKYYSVYYSSEQSGLYDFVNRDTMAEVKKFVDNLFVKSFELIHLNGKSSRIKENDNQLMS